MQIHYWRINNNNFFFFFKWELRQEVCERRLVKVVIYILYISLISAKASDKVHGANQQAKGKQLLLQGEGGGVAQWLLEV